MKKMYTAAGNQWIKMKCLEFFGNFIRNHEGTIEDDDVFLTVADEFSHDEIIKKIEMTYPKTLLAQLKNAKRYHLRLDYENESGELLQCLWNNKKTQKRVRHMIQELIEKLRDGKSPEDYADDFFSRKLDEVRQCFVLSETESELLLVMFFLRSNLLDRADGHSRRSNERDKMIFFAKCLDCDITLIMQMVAENGKLRRYACIDNDLNISCELHGFLNGVYDKPLASNFYRRSQDEVLPWDFYGALAEKHGGILKNLIRSGNGESGLNILLYGAPGTGKTSFARTLAHELNLACFSIAQDTGSESSQHSTYRPEYRFAALQVCDMQVDRRKSLIIVDEADEMLSSGSGLFAFPGSRNVSGDKGMLNHVLDNIRTPVIWITNTPAGSLDESSRRRFDYSIRFDALSFTQRLAIWKNNTAKMNLENLLDDETLAAFAGRYAVSAGGITLALKNMVKLNPEKKDVPALLETLLKPHCELLNIPVNDPKQKVTGDYSLEGLNIKGDIKLDRIVQAVRNFQNYSTGDADRPRMNLLLSGAPGTGKTEFVKYLGCILNKKLVVRMGSDLLSMWVGGTEQNIRQAFAQAEAEKAILFLDEIDGLVQSRERAGTSWEVTQVNELLHQMENFNGVMIGATNFVSNLDSAIMRRFTFKLEFDYLTDEGKKLFFERMFKTVLTDEEHHRLNEIPYLTPGDYRTVRQSLYYLGEEATNAERLSSLEQESLLKKHRKAAKKEKIGF